MEIQNRQKESAAYGDKYAIAYGAMDLKSKLAGDYLAPLKEASIKRHRSKVQMRQDSMRDGSKAVTRSESGENNLKQVMFSFFFQPKLFGLPTWEGFFYRRLTW